MMGLILFGGVLLLLVLFSLLGLLLLCLFVFLFVIHVAWRPFVTLVFVVRMPDWSRELFVGFIKTMHRQHHKKRKGTLGLWDAYGAKRQPCPKKGETYTAWIGRVTRRLENKQHWNRWNAMRCFDWYPICFLFTSVLVFSCTVYVSPFLGHGWRRAPYNLSEGTLRSTHELFPHPFHHLSIVIWTLLL